MLRNRRACRHVALLSDELTLIMTCTRCVESPEIVMIPTSAEVRKRNRPAAGLGSGKAGGEATDRARTPDLKVDYIGVDSAGDDIFVITTNSDKPVEFELSPSDPVFEAAKAAHRLRELCERHQFLQPEDPAESDYDPAAYTPTLPLDRDCECQSCGSHS